MSEYPCALRRHFEALSGTKMGKLKISTGPVPDDLRPIDGMQTRFKIITPGNAQSPEIVKGSRVRCHATGMYYHKYKGQWLTFWSTRTKDGEDKPFEYLAGVASVIDGWDRGCLGMKEGEVRTLKIPASEGYGDKGFKDWEIPGGATLNFKIEVLTIRDEGMPGKRRRCCPAPPQKKKGAPEEEEAEC
eukprot:TRINITY_DN23031_c0_g1_i1.p1 TRINITY_DN23031_c0_g1~~TRINITY_DN23031_c0_g1_i1.p1  ORF type:complete len:221 (+),score=64.15 TRINITY_DN23031_c0_g1_i1:101-664(+)